MAVRMHVAAILALLLPLPGTVMARKFGLFWCSNSYATDTAMTSSQAATKLSSFGPLKLVLEDGGSEDSTRSCSVLDIDMAAGTYSFSYKENGTPKTKQGAAVLTKGPPSFITLRGIGDKVLGGDSNGDANLFIMSADDSELVLLSCLNCFIFHYEYLYVFSNTYDSSNLSQVCSVETVKAKFDQTPILLQETC